MWFSIPRWDGIISSILFIIIQAKVPLADFSPSSDKNYLYGFSHFAETFTEGMLCYYNSTDNKNVWKQKYYSYTWGREKEFWWINVDINLGINFSSKYLYVLNIRGKRYNT